MEMALDLNKNAILTGYVDCLCLVCDSYLKTDNDVMLHIGKPIHKKNLDSTIYFEKYKNEFIRKVKKGYYCELCNHLLTTAANVGLHVLEFKHIDKKNGQMFKRIKNAVVIFDDVLINDRTWNGLIDDSCIVCNTEFDNELIHKTETNHVINLIQSRVEIHNDRNIYRKVDDKTFHCLTCNIVLALDSVDPHFNDSKHEKMYLGCQKEYVSHCSHATPNSRTDQRIKSTIPSINKGQTEVKENKNKCSTNETTKKDVKPSKQNGLQENQKNSSEKSIYEASYASASCVDEELEKFAKDNQLSYSAKNRIAYCRFCDSKVTSSLKNMKEHVAGAAHKINTKQEHANNTAHKKQTKANVSNSPVVVKQAFSNFKHVIREIESILMKYIIINDRFCISFFSFNMITRHDSKRRCQLCEIYIENDAHVGTLVHEKKIDDALILISFESEFIREVRPGLYHCGFCNLIEGSWENLENHLKSTNHKEKKTICNRRLQEYLPKIRQHLEVQEYLQMIRIMQMINSDPF